MLEISTKELTAAVREAAILANLELGWQPKVKFVDLIKMMIDADLQLFQRKGLGNG